MTLYIRNRRDNFPDLCDQRIYGITTTGDKYENKTPNIVNNDMRWTNFLSGIENPEWRGQVRSGQSATTPMNASKQSIKASKCLVEVATRWIPTGYPGNFSCCEWKGYPLYGFPTLTPADVEVISFVRNTALAKFLSHIQEHRNNSQYGETLGEWQETVKAVRRPLGALRDFIIAWRRRSRKRLRKYRRNGEDTARRDPNYYTNSQMGREAAKDLAGTYLEFVFGWIPLVKSTNEAVNAMLDRWQQPETVIVSGKAGADYSGTSTEQGLFTYQMFRVTQGVKTHSRIEHKYRACCETGAVDGKISVQQTLGLLPSDFVPTLYELFPFSFVLDYFLQVGDLVNAMSFRRDIIRWGTSTQRTFARREYSVPIIRVDPALGLWPDYRIIKQNAWGGNAVLEVSTVDRADILTVSLLPDLYWHLPFNQKAWYNMAAIFTSNFAKGV